MKLANREDGWYITKVPDCIDLGPYATKDLAADDMDGLERFYKHYEEPGFITCEDPRLRTRKA